MAQRRGARVFIVSNSFMQVPRADFVERVIVSAGPDVADDWIAERATSRTVVVTAGPAARRQMRESRRARALAEGAGMDAAEHRLRAGDAQSDDRPALGRRDDLRTAAVFGPRDRSAFLSALDLALTRMARAGGGR